jgi:hypothetical protein
MRAAQLVCRAERFPPIGLNVLQSARVEVFLNGFENVAGLKEQRLAGSNQPASR